VSGSREENSSFRAREEGVKFKIELAPLLKKLDPEKISLSCAKEVSGESAEKISKLGPIKIRFEEGGAPPGGGAGGHLSRCV